MHACKCLNIVHESQNQYYSFKFKIVVENECCLAS